MYKHLDLFRCRVINSNHSLVEEEINKAIKEEFENGFEYYGHDVDTGKLMLWFDKTIKTEE